MLTHMGSGSFESRVMAVRAAVAEQNPQSWGEAFAIGMTLVDPAVGNVNALLSEALTEWADGDWGEPVAAVSLVRSRLSLSRNQNRNGNRRIAASRSARTFPRGLYRTPTPTGRIRLSETAVTLLEFRIR